jgi:putative ATPase
LTGRRTGAHPERVPGEVVARESYPDGRVFEVVVGDLLTEPVDAIVNAANGHLAHGGGVAAAIARAAGPALEEEGDRIVRERGPVPVGDAVVTTAGRLPLKGVIHAVGPHQGLGREEERLVEALDSAFRRAHERGWASVSFPAVSSGIFAVPLEVCARAYVRAVRGFFAAHADTSLRTLRLCLFQGPLVALAKAELGKGG